MHLLAWYNLIFLIPLVCGLLLAFGATVGFGDAPQGIDIDGDGIPDIFIPAGHGHNEHDRLSFLGFGKVPMLLVLMTMALTFGGTGIAANLFLAPMLSVTGLFSGISVAIAFIVMVATTGSLSKLLARLMPTTETASTVKNDLVGCVGTLTLDADANSGAAQVTKGGDLFQVTVRAEEALPRGLSIILTEYDETKDTYAVVRSPLDK